ncbi:MAG: flagellar basal body P-ring protein FlgI, partial [Planctomycetaceae bacterium]
EMARRGVKEANKILSSPDTAMVVVIAYLPTMVRKGQKFDVRVVLPPDARAKSLKGGWLLETRLFEEHTVDNQVSLRPQEYAVAGGAVLTGLGVEDVRGERQAELMAGTIPGGAISKVDRDLRIMLLSDKRGIRNAQRVAEAVSARFHKYNKYGEKIACAEAQTDSLVNLQAHAQY